MYIYIYIYTYIYIYIYIYICWPPSRTQFWVPAVQGSTNTQSSESTCEVWEHAMELRREKAAPKMRANALTSAKT